MLPFPESFFHMSNLHVTCVILHWHVVTADNVKLGRAET